MGMETRGGVPRVSRLSVPIAGYDPNGHRLPAVSKELRIKNYGAAVLRVYFLDTDYLADTGYLEIEPGVICQGPFEIDRLWLKAIGGPTEVEILSFARRG